MDLASQIQSALRSQSVPLPSTTWLRALATARNPPPPLASLIATARTRVLASDLTTPNLLDASYAAEHSFPSAILPPATPTPTSQNNSIIEPKKEARLGRDVIVQILDLENITRSRWEQVEELEAIERGEQTRGREIIRIRDQEDDPENEENNGVSTASTAPPSATAAQQQQQQQASKNATHKLVVQDCNGHKMYALELKRIDRIGIGLTHIGEKMLLGRNTKVARGMILLEPGSCTLLGGKVDVWHKAWTEGRLARLREAVGAQDARR